MDLFVSGYGIKGTTSPKLVAEDAARDMLGMPPLSDLPRLYHNNGNNTFTDVSAAYGVDHVNFTMGCNFGDINSDGFLDFYLATGDPLYQALVPNKMYLNI